MELGLLVWLGFLFVAFYVYIHTFPPSCFDLQPFLFSFSLILFVSPSSPLNIVEKYVVCSFDTYSSKNFRTIYFEVK